MKDEIRELTLKEKIKDILRTTIIWVVLWTIFEFIINSGPISTHSIDLYTGAILGYAVSMIGPRCIKK